jgi:tetratricopeptide (TPR) repeat protein
MRAWKRNDVPAAVNLLGRATALRPAGEPWRRELQCELGVALRTAGDAEATERTLEEALAAATAAGDRRIELRAQIELAYVRLLGSPEGGADELLELATGAIPALAAFGDDRALGRAWLLAGFVHGGVHCRHAAWEEAAEHALVHYRRVPWPAATCLGELAAALYYGPSPVERASRRCRTLLADTSDRASRANLLVFLGGLTAMRGDFVEARRLVDEARVIYDELGQIAIAATYGEAVVSDIELLAGDREAAARILRALCDVHERMHNWSALSTRAADLAGVLYKLQRFDEAERLVETYEGHTMSDDLTARPRWNGVRAKLLARRGAIADADAVAREAVRLAEHTDALNQRARVLLDVAEVLQLSERPSEAAAVVMQAARLYERKGNLVAAEHARSLLTEPVRA